MPKKRKDGRYEIKVRISKTGEKPGRYKAYYGLTLKEAREKAKAAQAEIDAGVNLEANPTVASVIDSWLALKEATTRPQTYVSYKNSIKNITKRIGDVQARDIDVTTARNVIAEIAQDVSPYMANRCRMLASSAFKDAIIRGIISQNSWEKVPILPQKSHEKRALTDAELALIDKADLIPQDRALITVLRYTGCRIGEALALNVSDLDFENHRIHITKSLFDQAVGPTKTKAGTRWVPMPPVLETCLADYTATYLDSDCPLLFPSTVGTYVGTRSRHNRWQSMSRRIFGGNVPEDFTPHIFRHTYASTLVKNHIAPTTAQLLLGHDSLQTTLKTYAHYGYSDIDTDAVMKIFSSESSSNAAGSA